MTVQKSHGKRYAQPPRPDELPRPVAAPQPEPSGPVQRDRSGKVATREAAAALGRKGGQARAARAADRAPSLVRLRRLLPASIQPDAVFAEYMTEAERWGRAYAEDLSNERAGGKLGPGVLALVRMAIRAHAEWHFLADVVASGVWRFEHDEKRKPSTMPRTDLPNEVLKLEAHFARLQGWIEKLARDAAKNRPKPSPWYASTAALPSTTTSPRSDSVNPSSGDDGRDDERDEPSHDVEASEPADEDAGDEPTKMPARPAPVVVPLPDPAPWLPVEALKPYASTLYADLQPLAAGHPLGFRAALLPRTVALCSRRAFGDERLGGHLVEAVKAWLAQPSTPGGTT